MSARPEVPMPARASTLTDPLFLLTAGLLLELAAVIAAVLPARPVAPVAPIALALAGLALATLGAVGLARDDGD